MEENVIRLRSLGVATEGVPDQYADGIAAKLWEIYIGEKAMRTNYYRDFLVNLLQTHKCQRLLDVACGTGIDSILLLDEGFNVMSVDASDKMLKYALKKRWQRRNEKAFDSWVIEEANWLTLTDDIKKPGEGFDALICLGNSFAHLPDISGNMSEIKTAIKNFHAMLKPGGYLIIDHRNYDYTLRTGKTPARNLYYDSQYVKKIETSVLTVDFKPVLITLDYTMDISQLEDKFDKTDSEYTKKGRYDGNPVGHFRLSYFPHQLENFTKLLLDVFGDTKKEIYGDFQPLGTIEDPAYYIHVVRKQKSA